MSLKQYRLSLLAGVSTIVLASLNPAHAQSTTAEIYGLYLHRGGTADNTLLPAGFSSPAITTDGNLDLGWGGGLGGRLAIQTNPMSGWEVSGFYTRHKADFATEDNASSWSFTNSGSFLSDINAWRGTDAAFGDYESRFFGGEVSYTQKLNPSTTLSIGPRVAVLDEDINLFAVDEGGLNPLNAGEPDGRMSIDVSNRLVGLQVGVALQGTITPGLNAKGSLKGGVYANFANRDLVYSNKGTNFASSSDETSLAGIVEANLELAVPLSNGIELFAGGTVSVLAGVATGPANVPTANTSAEFNDIDSGDTIYYAGAKAGMRVKF